MLPSRVESSRAKSQLGAARDGWVGGMWMLEVERASCVCLGRLL